MLAAPGMPKDWDDHAGWELYYAGRVEAAARIEDRLPFGLSSATRFALWLEARGYRKAWFPGCGLDGSTRVYACLGWEVYATDVAASAVAYQRTLAERPCSRLGDSALQAISRNVPDFLARSDGSLEAFSHDFREPFPKAPCDCLLNIRSYQGLPPDSMDKAARTFFAALRPGGHAFFDTQNVQGERRNRLEDALLNAGFVLPGLDAERWFRCAVAETGIDHTFILGRPMVLRGSRYQGSEGDARFAADRERLRTLEDEFKSRAQAASDSVQRLWADPYLRTATVVYNTG